jgi:hypothetical protein
MQKQFFMHAYLSEAEIYNDYSIPPLIQTLGEIKQEFSQQVFLNAIEEGKIVSSVRAYFEKETAIWTTDGQTRFSKQWYRNQTHASNLRAL